MVTLSGQRLGDYDIGAFRFRAPAFTAYTGKHRASGLEVGILHGTPRSGVDFESEFALLKALRAPGLPLLLAWGELRGTDRVIVTGPLGEAVWTPGEPRVEWLYALGHLSNIGACLARAAEAGICHGSLTPECIRTDSNDEIMIVGIGATRLFALTRDGMHEKPRFLAPEQFQRQGLGDAPTDIYALGMCLYAMLLGREPFAAADRAHLPALAQHGAVEPIVHKDIPFVLNALIRQMTAKDRALRFQVYAEVINEAAGVFVRASHQHPEVLRRALAEADESKINDGAVKELLDNPEALTTVFAPRSEDEPGSGPRISGAEESDVERRDDEELCEEVTEEPILLKLLQKAPANDEPRTAASSRDTALDDAALRPPSPAPAQTLTRPLRRVWWMAGALVAFWLPLFVFALRGTYERSALLVDQRPMLRALRPPKACPPRTDPGTGSTAVEKRTEDGRHEEVAAGKWPGMTLGSAGVAEPGWKRKHVDEVFEY